MTDLYPAQELDSRTSPTLSHLFSNSSTSLSQLTARARENFLNEEEGRGGQEEAVLTPPPPPQVKRAIHQGEARQPYGDAVPPPPTLPTSNELIEWLTETEGKKYARNGSPRAYAIGCLKTQADIDHWMSQMLKAKATEQERAVVSSAGIPGIEDAIDRIGALLKVHGFESRQAAIEASELFIIPPVIIEGKLMNAKLAGKHQRSERLADEDILKLLDWLEGL